MPDRSIFVESDLYGLSSQQPVNGQYIHICDICHILLFYTDRIFGSQILHPKINEKKPRSISNCQICTFSHIPDICHFYAGKIFGAKICTEKGKNYKKWVSQQMSINRNLLGQANNNRVYNYTLSLKAHLVCVKIKKRYTQIELIFDFDLKKN